MALADLYGKILALGVSCIRKHTVMPLLVNHASNEDPTTTKSRGGTVEVIVPPEFQTRDVVPGSTPPASQAAPAPTTVPVPLNYWKEVNFPLTERDIALMENNAAYVPMFLENAAAAVADDISSSICQQYKGVYGYVGTPGTTPFSVSPLPAQNAKQVLTEQRCPKGMRQIVLDTSAYGNATGLEAFRAAFAYGSPEVIREGEISRGYGFDWHEDLNIQEHENPNGTPTSYLVNGARPVGSVTVNIDTGINAPVEGDIFTVAGDAQTYVVLGFAAGQITFAPRSQAAWADNAAITFRPAHTVNLAFHPMAFAFVSRPNAQLMLPELQRGKVVSTWVDDMTGVALKLVIADEYHQTGFYLSCLWGTELIDARLATRIAG